MRSSPIIPLLIAVTAVLAACSHHTDSIASLDRIPFGGTNQANIAAMVANPTDLVHGRGQKTVDGATGAAPVERILTDHQKTLLNPGRSASSGGASGG